MAFPLPSSCREVPKSVSSNQCISLSPTRLCQQESLSALLCTWAASQAGCFPSTLWALVDPSNPSSLCKRVRNFSWAFALHVTQVSSSMFLPVPISLHQKAKWVSLERHLRSGGHTRWLQDAQVVSQRLTRLVGQNTCYLAHFLEHVLSDGCSPAWCSSRLCPRLFAHLRSRVCAFLPGQWQAGLCLLPPSPAGSSACRGLQRFWAQSSAEHHSAWHPGVHWAVLASSIN